MPGHHVHVRLSGPTTQVGHAREHRLQVEVGDERTVALELLVEVDGVSGQYDDAGPGRDLGDQLPRGVPWRPRHRDAGEQRCVVVHELDSTLAGQALYGPKVILVDRPGERAVSAVRARPEVKLGAGQGEARPREERNIPDVIEVQVGENQ